MPCILFRKIVDHNTVNGSTVSVCTLDLSKAFNKVNHSALLVKLMNRNVPVNLLMLLEYWLLIHSLVLDGVLTHLNSTSSQLVFGKEAPSRLVSLRCMSILL